jgi:hypothetical protein
MPVSTDNAGMRFTRQLLILLGGLVLATGITAQTPQVFPLQLERPGQISAPPPAAISATPAASQNASQTDELMERQFGLPVYSRAQFVASYDAGRGQQYFIFGTGASFTEVVAAYRTLLKKKGRLIFDHPPTHTFETNKFREKTMGFQPGITIKDFTATGSAGYPNPQPGEQPERFATLIQIVPPPPE